MKRQRSAVVALVACVVVIVGGGLAFWFFVLRDTAPPKASLSGLGGSSASTAARPSGTGGAAPSSADGTWTVAKANDVFVGYRIQELFGGETVKKEAAGRTAEVTGTMVVQGSTIPSASVTADVTKLKSDRAQRDNAIRNQALETDRFGTATFTLTQPITLASPPVVGERQSVQATGDLTLHGQTKPVTLALQAEWTGDTIAVAGSAPIVLAEYGIAPISTGFVSVDDQGELELQLVFTRS